MTDSIREKILVALVNLFKQMDASQPVDDPYGVSFKMVERTNIEKLQPGKASAIGIYDQGEVKSPKTFPTMEAVLTVFIEFHLYVATVDVTTTELNKYLAAIERRLHEDQTLGGLCYDLVVVRNEISLDGAYDKQASGMVEVTIKYRHKLGDPRRKPSGAFA